MRCRVYISRTLCADWALFSWSYPQMRTLQFKHVQDMLMPSTQRYHARDYVLSPYILLTAGCARAHCGNPAGAHPVQRQHPQQCGPLRPASGC